MHVKDCPHVCDRAVHLATEGQVTSCMGVSVSPVIVTTTPTRVTPSPANVW